MASGHEFSRDPDVSEWLGKVTPSHPQTKGELEYILLLTGASITAGSRPIPFRQFLVSVMEMVYSPPKPPFVGQLCSASRLGWSILSQDGGVAEKHHPALESAVFRRF